MKIVSTWDLRAADLPRLESPFFAAAKTKSLIMRISPTAAILSIYWDDPARLLAVVVPQETTVPQWLKRSCAELTKANFG